MTSPEHNRTLHKRCPGFLPDRLISLNRKTYLITYPQSIDLMPRARAMKIDFPVLPVIKIIERDRIRIPIIPIHRQNTSPAVSYTHLDVYKRQVLTSAGVSSPSMPTSAENVTSSMPSFPYVTESCVPFPSLFPSLSSVS